MTISDRGRAIAASRATDAIKAIHRAKRAVEKDFERNFGIYPYNSGVITASELLRRAGLEKSFLAKPRHRELRDDVNAWVKGVQLKVKRGSEVIRRAITERNDASKAEADAIRQRWIEAELEYVEAQSVIASLREQSAVLQKENERLMALLSSANVISIRSECR